MTTQRAFVLGFVMGMLAAIGIAATWGWNSPTLTDAERSQRQADEGDFGFPPK